MRHYGYEYPGLVWGYKFSYVSAASDSACGINQSRIYCWGNDYYQTLGDGSLDDDLAFFVDLNHALASNGPVYVNLNGEDGVMKYLDSRKNVLTGKIDYFIVRGDIEKLCWDYSFNKDHTDEIDLF